MIALPKSLKILGRKVTIRMTKDLVDSHADWDATKYLIRVQEGQDKLDELDSLLHEAMHGVLHCQGRESGSKTEEIYVRALATGTLMVLRENPKLVEYLMQDIKL